MLPTRLHWNCSVCKRPESWPTSSSNSLTVNTIGSKQFLWISRNVWSKSNDWLCESENMISCSILLCWELGFLRWFVLKSPYPLSQHPSTKYDIRIRLFLIVLCCLMSVIKSRLAAPHINFIACYYFLDKLPWAWRCRPFTTGHIHWLWDSTVQRDRGSTTKV